MTTGIAVDRILPVSTKLRWLMLASLVLPLTGVPAQVRRYGQNPTSPILSGVEVLQGSDVLILSGQVPDRTTGESAGYGDTETQSSSVFRKIEAELTSRGYSMGDVVKLTVFLVGDPEREGHMDFRGFGRAYARYFGTSSQPNLAARSVVQVAGLVDPGWRVEIEAVAVKPRGRNRR